MEKPQDCFVKVGQINTRYWTMGSHHSPIILIHGIGGNVESWLPNFQALAAKHRVYALDLLGHGLTDKPLDVSYDVLSLAQFVKGFIAVLGIDHAHLVGHSLGGGVALQFALTFPSAIDRLVLVASAGLGREAALALRISSLPLLGEYLTRPSLSGTKQSMQSIIFDPTLVTDDLVEQNYRLALLPDAQKAFLKTLRAVGDMSGQKQNFYAPIVAGLPTLRRPVMVVWGY
jgi:4,5:9,10-diseco-3-hydroxy-5,9,17-trioxoandrosta-1(10),2-diene-4-oate hydrolase